MGMWKVRFVNKSGEGETINTLIHDNVPVVKIILELFRSRLSETMTTYEQDSWRYEMRRKVLVSTSARPMAQSQAPDMPLGRLSGQNDGIDKATDLAWRGMASSPHRRKQILNLVLAPETPGGPSREAHDFLFGRSITTKTGAESSQQNAAFSSTNGAHHLQAAPTPQGYLARR
jgi:hypothetical protein